MDKWQDIRDDMLKRLAEIKYKGTGKYSLLKHATFHKHAIANLENCKRHVNVTLPNERSRVSSFLNSIDCDDSKMTARVEFVQSNDAYLRSFDDTVSYLLPVCPVKSTKTRNDKNNTKSSNVSSLNLKSGTGKTGVELRWYPLNDWKKLTDAQRDECNKWSKTELGKVAFQKQRKAWKDKRKNEQQRKHKQDNDNSSNDNKTD